MKIQHGPWVRGGAAVSFVSLAALMGLSGCSNGDDEETPGATCPLPSASAVSVEELAFVQLGAFGSASCGLANDGKVSCWGAQPDSFSSATEIEGVEQAASLVVDELGGCVLRRGGSVVCWMGDEVAGVPGICGATAITQNRCAVVGGAVHCWDVRYPERLGATEAEAARGPVAVPGVAGAVSVASGPNDYTCAALEDGTVMCWSGGPRPADRPGVEPAAVPEISGAIDVVGAPEGSSVGGVLTEMCAILEDRSVTCWSRARAPSAIDGLSDVVSLSLSQSHACAVSSDGSLRCWGENQMGQLGDGTTEAKSEPTLVEALTNVVQVTTGSLDSSIGHSCALLTDGTAWCWGANFMGQLGDGSVTDSAQPVAVEFP